MTHTEVDRATDRLMDEVNHLGVLLDDLTPANVELVLSQAKRVRRDSNLVVRAIAQYRDQTTA